MIKYAVQWRVNFMTYDGYVASREQYNKLNNNNNYYYYVVINITSVHVIMAYISDIIHTDNASFE